MENRKGNGIFLSVIGVATLVVAIIGATFAYFSASAVSNNDAVSVQGANLTLGYWDDPSGLNTDLIPTLEKYALFAATNPNWVNNDTNPESPTYNKDAIEGAQGLCYDQNKNEICATYVFMIGNPNFTTSMNINGKITTTVNEFANLKFAIYNEKNEQVFAPTALPTTAGQFVELGNLDQDVPLVGSSADIENEDFVADDPSTYTKIDTNSDGIAENVRKYTVVIWIEEWIDPETGKPGDQTSLDAGKIFTAGLTFDTGSGSGVTGLIAAADSTTPADPSMPNVDDPESGAE